MLDVPEVSHWASWSRFLDVLPSCQHQDSDLTFLFFIPAKAREYVFTGVGLSVCVSVCLSVTTITKKIVGGFVPNFMERFLGGKGRPSSCFVMISRGMWVKKTL